jgi:ribosomal protein L44E
MQYCYNECIEHNEQERQSRGKQEESASNLSQRRERREENALLMLCNPKQML